jgi:DNA-binding MarR family transcriptional regulator
MWINLRRFWRLLQSFNLTHPQFIALKALTMHACPCTMTDLTNTTMHDPPTMTGIVDRLVKMGLVERTRCDTDRRVVLVRTTPSGVELLRQVDKRFVDDDFFGYASLSDIQLDELEKLLGYVLRMHVRRYTTIENVDADTELGQLETLLLDPIAYAK